MGAGKPRIRLGRGGAVAAAVAMTALASACGSAVPASSLAADAVLAPATPTMAPAAVPVLGALTFGTFPSTQDGTLALGLCEQWAGLRAAYVARLRDQTPYGLEQWFSSSQWRVAFNDNGPLRTDPAYTDVSTAFGLVSSAAGASVANAKLLDQACASAD